MTALGCARAARASVHRARLSRGRRSRRSGWRLSSLGQPFAMATSRSRDHLDESVEMCGLPRGEPGTAVRGVRRALETRRDAWRGAAPQNPGPLELRLACTGCTSAQAARELRTSWQRSELVVLPQDLSQLTLSQGHDGCARVRAGELTCSQYFLQRHTPSTRSPRADNLTPFASIELWHETRCSARP